MMILMGKQIEDLNLHSITILTADFSCGGAAFYFLIITASFLIL